MALLVTTRILKLRNIQILHIEPTDVCQAACPLCAREIDVEFNKSKKNHLTIEQILKVFSVTQIQKLDKMYMCGVYGDPAAGKHTLEIYKYFRSINPTVVLGMNTNGAIQATDWWKTLAQTFNQKLDYCVFSIDGLEDTNSIYRKNVDWQKLMSNAQTFIDSGGSAHWDMLVYKHNQHQVDACEQLAKNLGFKWFRAKVSRRGVIDSLEMPVGWQIPSQSSGVISCLALKEQSMYIDSQGRVSPCCWLGARQSNFITEIEDVSVDWGTDSANPICVNTCSVTEKSTVFESQWQREVELSS